jgi:D-serine deaminase-like pyridoxal phosphate-dependent protein
VDLRPTNQVASVKLEDLQTPCLILDKGILERNLKRMSDTVHRNGVVLRPHLKTAKSAEIARMATAGEAGGITVSTLAEAEYFSDNGFRDILVAAAQPPQKLERAAKLIERGAAITLVVDELDMARAIDDHPAGFRALIELDSGDGRAGIKPDNPLLIDIARALKEKFAGVMTHEGHSYGCRDAECIRAIAEDERSTVVNAAALLNEARLKCETVSVGSTPTMTYARNLDGVTEARPGVYMFHDLMQVEIGSCTRDDIALTVLASVIGRNENENRALIDAGALALSKDRSTQATPHDAGYGEVWDIDARPMPGSCVVKRVYQEHGVITSNSRLPFDKLAIGTKVRIGPNHACITAAAHDRYYVVDGGLDIIAEWDRINGW